ncbi:MAG TPA: hypothetical protein DEA91_20570 [Paenibacillus sp.]|nr:hypothetical protein [Paenibacillus sp.]
MAYLPFGGKMLYFSSILDLRKGTPADNAPIESFHSTLKSETFYLEDLTFTTTAIVVQTVRAKLNNHLPVNFRRLATSLIRCFDPCLTQGGQSQTSANFFL